MTDRQTDRSALRADDPPRKIQLTHLNHNNILTTYSQTMPLENSLLEGHVVKFDVSSIICGRVASTREASQLSFVMCSTILWNMVVPHATRHTERFHSGGVTTLISSWKGATWNTHIHCLLGSFRIRDPEHAKFLSYHVSKKKSTESKSQTRLSINDHPQRRQQTRSHIVTQTCSDSTKQEWSAVQDPINTLAESRRGLARSSRAAQPQCGPRRSRLKLCGTDSSTTSFDKKIRDAFKVNDQDSFHNTFPRPVYKDSDKQLHGALRCVFSCCKRHTVTTLKRHICNWSHWLCIFLLLASQLPPPIHVRQCAQQHVIKTTRSITLRQYLSNLWHFQKTDCNMLREAFLRCELNSPHNFFPELWFGKIDSLLNVIFVTEAIGSVLSVVFVTLSPPEACRSTREDISARATGITLSPREAYGPSSTNSPPEGNPCPKQTGISIRKRHNPWTEYIHEARRSAFALVQK